MNILHIVSSLRSASGVSTFVAGAANALVAQGQDVTVATLDTNAVDGQALLDARVRRRTVAEILVEVSCQARAYQVAHLHGLWQPCLHRSCSALDRAGVPIVWCTHGMLAPWSLAHKRWKKILPWFLYQKNDLRKAICLHATTELEKRWIRRLNLGIPIQVIPIGSHVVEPRVLSCADGNDGGRILLYVGRLYPVKALDRLIEAFAQVDEKVRRPWRLRLVGPDQAGHRRELEELCRRLRVQFSVDFAGPKFGLDLVAEYDACSVLALVSHTENFGATVVDALASCRPVLTSVNTPWREVVEHRCGWCVENDVETLSATLTDIFLKPPEELKSMGVEGRRLVEERYSWPAVARRLVHLYDGVSSLMAGDSCVGARK